MQERGILQPCFDKGISFLVKSQNKNGSWGENGDVYCTAMAMKTLCTGKNNIAERNNAINYLLNAQHQNSSWKTSEIIWQFHDHEGDLWRALDTNNVITTAVCVEALKNSLI